VEKTAISIKGLNGLLKVFRGRAGYAQNQVRRMQRGGMDPRDYEVFVKHLENREHYRLLSERLAKIIKTKVTNERTI